MTKISIAMATYNGTRFIRPQLDSFARQTVLPTELIVCDDGSTDSTLSILNNFSRSAPFPVRIVKNAARLGHTGNFLKAARICQGDLIAFSDQDDEWLPQKLHRILEASCESDALLFAHAVEWIDKDDAPTGVVYPLHPRYRKNLLINDFPGHAIVFRRSLLEMTADSLAAANYKAVAGEVEFGHDVLLLEIAIAMDKVFFIPDVLMRWRIHSPANHAWTDLLVSPPRAKVSFAKWLFPSDLAHRYAEAADSFRRHSLLLSSIRSDMAAFGGDAAIASERLVNEIRLLARRADVMDLRARLYASSSRKTRAKLILEGAAVGQYRPSGRGGVGMHNALRDMLACLLG